MLELSMICKELVFREIDISVRFCQKVLLMCVILTTCTWYNEITCFLSGTYIPVHLFSYFDTLYTLTWLSKAV